MEPAQTSATRAEGGYHAARGKIPTQPRLDPWHKARTPPRLTHRVHVEEECVLVLAGVETFNGIHQGWISIVEVRMGNEQRCIWMRSKTASAHPNPSETFC